MCPPLPSTMVNFSVRENGVFSGRNTQFGLTHPEKKAYSRMIMGNQKGFARHRKWQIREPAAQSKLRELRQRARSACFVPVMQIMQNNRDFTLSPLTLIFVTLFVTRKLKKALQIPVTPFSAESEGFEPPDPLRSTVFKTAAFDHSANSPICI